MEEDPDGSKATTRRPHLEGGGRRPKLCVMEIRG